MIITGVCFSKVSTNGEKGCVFSTVNSRKGKMCPNNIIDHSKGGLCPNFWPATENTLPQSMSHGKEMAVLQLVMDINSGLCFN